MTLRWQAAPPWWAEAGPWNLWRQGVQSRQLLSEVVVRVILPGCSLFLSLAGRFLGGIGVIGAVLRTAVWQLLGGDIVSACRYRGAAR